MAQRINVSGRPAEPLPRDLLLLRATSLLQQEGEPRAPARQVHDRVVVAVDVVAFVVAFAVTAAVIVAFAIAVAVSVHI